jgi:hypothetical protein
MDRYKEILQHDVRLIRRDIRHHLISEEQVEAYRETLPDSSANARWLRQDGTPCTPEEEQQVIAYHQDTLLRYTPEEGASVGKKQEAAKG